MVAIGALLLFSTSSTYNIVAIPSALVLASEGRSDSAEQHSGQAVPDQSVNGDRSANVVIALAFGYGLSVFQRFFKLLLTRRMAAPELRATSRSRRPRGP